MEHDSVAWLRMMRDHSGLDDCKMQFARIADEIERLRAGSEVPTFQKQIYGAVVATIHDNDHECLEVVKRQDGRFELTIHNRRGETDHFDDLSVILKPEQVGAIGQILEAAKRYDAALRSLKAGGGNRSLKQQENGA